MTPRLRLAAWLAGAFVVGALGFLLLGQRPASPEGDAGQAVHWRLPVPPSGELEAADAVWSGRAPWGTAAGPGGANEPAAMPPPVLVGVVAEDGGFRAVFIVSGLGEVQARIGDELPDGSRVTAVSRFSVEWTDAQGNQHEQELLADPLPPANRGSH